MKHPKPDDSDEDDGYNKKLLELSPDKKCSRLEKIIQERQSLMQYIECKQPPSRELKTLEREAIEGLRGESIFLSDLPPATEDSQH